MDRDFDVVTGRYLADHEAKAARDEDIARRIIQAGADHTYLTMSEAGTGLAEHVARSIQERSRLLSDGQSEIRPPGRPPQPDAQA